MLDLLLLPARVAVYTTCVAGRIIARGEQGAQARARARAQARANQAWSENPVVPNTPRQPAAASDHPIGRREFGTVVVCAAIMGVVLLVACLRETATTTPPPSSTYTVPTLSSLGTSTLYAPGPDGNAISCGTNDARMLTAPACRDAWQITDGGTG